MHSLVLECSQILKQVQDYYQKALQLGECIPEADVDQLQDLLDERFRIVQMTAPLMHRFKVIQSELMQTTLPAQEIGFIKEQRARLRDFAPRFTEQQRRVGLRVRQRMVQIRHSLVGHNQSAQAIRSYLSAPQAKPFI